MPPTPSGTSDRHRPEALDIFTMASDSRASELAVLLESLSAHPLCRVSVIPFNERMDLVQRLCAVYGARVVRPAPEWDQLGRVIYKDARTRRRPSWRYFRKFNALSCAQGAFAFIDSNVLVFEDPRTLLESETPFDVAFGARSNPGRNFKPWGKYVLRHIAPDLRDGFQAAFWVVAQGALDPEELHALTGSPTLSGVP